MTMYKFIILFLLTIVLGVIGQESDPEFNCATVAPSSPAVEERDYVGFQRSSGKEILRWKDDSTITIAVNTCGCTLYSNQKQQVIDARK